MNITAGSNLPALDGSNLTNLPGIDSTGSATTGPVEEDTTDNKGYLLFANNFDGSQAVKSNSDMVYNATGAQLRARINTRELNRRQQW